MTGTSALIPAAGRGRRFGRGSNKVLAEVAGRPIIAHTLAVFQSSPLIDDVTLVCGEEDVDACEGIVRRFRLDKVAAIVEGGVERQESVWNGLLRVGPQAEIIVIHDGARPLVTEQMIAESASAAAAYGAAIAAAPIGDTVKVSDERAFVRETLPRDELFAVQTPQAFRRKIILDAHERARTDGFTATDDAALVERLGLPVKIIAGSPENVKVTEPRDLEYVSARLSGGASPLVRFGFGYDIHRFAAGRRLFLGGVEFPGEVGLEGHSDADVLLHAVCDALLGAAALGDIGRLFLNTDPRFKDMSSMKLLGRVADLLAEAAWRVVNVDVTLVAEKPRIGPFAREMQGNIASALGTAEGCISVKATTAEGLGAIGRAEGIACYAVAGLTRSVGPAPRERL